MESAKCEYSDIVIIPHFLDFETEEGSQFVPPTQDLFIKKAGSGLPASWDAEVTGDGPQYWIELSTMSGSVPKRVRVHCKSIGMPSGEWNGEIKIIPRVEGVKVTPSVIPVKLKVKGKETEEPEEPKEPPEEPPSEPPEKPPEEPGQPPKEPPKEPEPPPEEKSWWRKFIEWLRQWWKYTKLRYHWRAFWTRLHWAQICVDGRLYWYDASSFVLRLFLQYPGPSMSKDEYDHWFVGHKQHSTDNGERR
jgi:hypothetical protein